MLFIFLIGIDLSLASRHTVLELQVLFHPCVNDVSADRDPRAVQS